MATTTVMAPVGVTTVGAHRDHSGPQRAAENLWPPQPRSTNQISSPPRPRCRCPSHPVPPSSNGLVVQARKRALPRTPARGQGRVGAPQPTPHVATSLPVAAVAASHRGHGRHATRHAGTVRGAAQPPADTPPVCPSPYASGAAATCLLWLSRECYPPTIRPTSRSPMGAPKRLRSCCGRHRSCTVRFRLQKIAMRRRSDTLSRPNQPARTGNGDEDGPFPTELGCPHSHSRTGPQTCPKPGRSYMKWGWSNPIRERQDPSVDVTT